MRLGTVVGVFSGDQAAAPHKLPQDLSSKRRCPNRVIICTQQRSVFVRDFFTRRQRVIALEATSASFSASQKLKQEDSGCVRSNR